jgi:hypothetical protein
MTNKNQQGTPPGMDSGSQGAEEKKTTISGGDKGKSRKEKKRNQKFATLIRIFSYTILIFSGAIAIALAWGKAHIDGRFIERYLKAMVAQQTGSRLEFDSIQFNALSGIDLKGVRIFPPERGSISNSSRGQLRDPVFTCNQIEARYSLLGLLAGQINIKAVRLVRPQINIKNDANGSNLDGITEFRSFMKNEGKKSGDSVADENGTPQRGALEILESFDPGQLYLPFKIVIRNVGIKDLGINFVDLSIKGRTSETILSGLGVDLGVLWSGSQSDIWVALGSGSDGSFHIEKTEKIIGNKSSDSVMTQLILVAAVKGRIHAKDFSSLKLDFATRIIEEESKGIPKLKDPILAGLHVDLNYHDIVANIRKIFLEIPGMVSFDTTGSLQMIRGDTASMGIDLRQKLEINLAPIASFAKQFIDDFEASGKIYSDNFHIKGRLNPSEPKTFLELGSEAPRIGGSLAFEKINLVMRRPEIRLQSMSGELKLGTDRDALHKNIGINTNLNVFLESGELSSSLDEANLITSVFSSLSSKIDARFLWPQAKLQKSHISVEAKKFGFNGNHAPLLHAPLRIEITADGETDLSQADLNANVDWVDVAQSSLIATCNFPSGIFHISTKNTMNSMEKIFLAGKPILQRLLPLSFKPSRFKGSIETQIDIQGKIPGAKNASVDDVFRNGDIKFDSQLILRRIDLSIPFKNLDIAGFGLKVQAKGDLEKQRLIIATELSDTKLVVEPKKLSAEDGPIQESLNKLALKKISGDIEILNKLKKGTTLKQAVASSQTSIRINSSIGSVRGIEGLESVLDGGRFELEASQSNFRYLNVKEIGIRLPKLGALSLLSGRASLDDQYIPVSMGFEAKAELSRMDRDRLIRGLRSSGGATVTIQASTSNMKNISLNGLAEIDDLSIEIVDPDQLNKNKLKIMNMSGRVPISQSIIFPIHEFFVKRNDIVATKESSTEKKLSVEGSGKNENIIESIHDLDQTLVSDVQSYLATKASDPEAKVSRGSRVDYGSLKIFYPQKKPIKIHSLIAANIELNDILVDMDVRPNLFSINEYSFEVLGGRIHGDLQVDFAVDPVAAIRGRRDASDFIKKISTSMQLTRLDTRRLLDRIPSARLPGKSNLNFFSSPYLDATMRARWNAETSDVSGAIDITTIGKEQMRMLLSYIDPQDENPTIVDIRKALLVGEVRKVSIPMRNGEIGLEVDIRALGIPLPTPSLSRFPMSQILDNMKRTPGHQSKKQGAPS